MTPLWMGLSPGSRSTRMVAIRGSSEAILQAQLSSRPSRTSALPLLLEAISLWEGAPVCVAVDVDERSTSSYPTTLFRDLFDVFGETTPHYRVEWVPREVHRRRGRPHLQDDFADLAHLLTRKSP